MSKRAIKLLRRLSIETGMDMKKAKKMWKTLSHIQRGEFRKRMDEADANR